MIYTILPYNPILKDMRFNDNTVVISFKKNKGIIQERSYNVTAELAYKLFYTKTAADSLKAYNEIKKQGRLIDVKTIK